MKKAHILNVFAGLIIIVIMIFHIVNGGYPAFPVVMIVLFVASYIMERKGIDTFYWGALTSVSLFISLWTIVPRLFFGP